MNDSSPPDAVLVARDLRKSFSQGSEAIEVLAGASFSIAARERVAILGRSGSGKSTFGRYLCLCLAGEELGGMPLDLTNLNGQWSRDEPELWPWPHGLLLPFFVELRRFVRDDTFPGTDEAGQARHLVAYLAKLDPSGDTSTMAKLVRNALDKGALVVLDGLDETPSADQVRPRLKQVIQSFAKLYPECRMLVTSRPHAYEQGQDWRLDEAGFVEEKLAPFDWPKIERFVSEAYSAFALRNRLKAEDSAELSRDLLASLKEQPTLGPLATQPLMLTMMTDLHAARGGRLPDTAAELFEESMTLLFDRWNERRMVGGTVADLVGMSKPQIRSALELLAFRVHGRSGDGTDGENGADVSQADLLDALVDTRKHYGIDDAFSPEAIRDYLNERSGILIAESPSLYRFPHRYYQEYLAACYLEREPDYRQSCLESDPASWRETFLFLAGRLAHKSEIWKLIDLLAPESPPDHLEAEDLRFYPSVIAGLAIRENQLWRRGEERHEGKLERVRLWLRRCVELGALDVKDRAEAGQVLGLLGDDRPGVGLGADGLPDIEWVEIPAGEFVMGSEKYDDEKPMHQERVESFQISRFPVTNAQYTSFVEDSGYTEKWRHCWTVEGWAWKKELSDPEVSGHPFNLPNHPKVGASWFEAVAFCNWLSERTGTAFRLPTEAEWERSARGTDGFEFPWGEDFAAHFCNVGETGLGFTTAVGTFPGGESPRGQNGIGLLDASGNVWEWCSTKRRKSYDEGPSDWLESEDSSRVLRGGAWFSGLLFASCAFRSKVGLGIRGRDVGFRLVAPI